MGKRSGYRHKLDSIDELMLALGKLYSECGMAAFRDALPEGVWPAVDRLMDIRKVGPVAATEIVVRAGLFCEGEIDG